MEIVGATCLRYIRVAGRKTKKKEQIKIDDSAKFDSIEAQFLSIFLIQNQNNIIECDIDNYVIVIWKTQAEQVTNSNWHW